MTDQPSSVFVTYIVTTPEKLWQALTNGDFTKQYFFGRRMESDWKVGAPWRLIMEDGQIDSEGIVLESEPPHRLAISWRMVWVKEGQDLPEAKVAFQIDPLGRVVRLTVSQFNDPSLPGKFVEGGRNGWPIIISGLKSLLETGHPLPPFELPELPKE